MFYRIEAYLDNTETIQNIRDGVVKNEIAVEFAEKSEELFQRCRQACYLFAVSSKDRKILFGAITKDIDDIENIFWKYAKNLSVQIEKAKIEEVTYKVWRGLLRSAERNDFISDDVNVSELFGIENLTGQVKEYMLGRIDSREKLMETARSLLLGATLGTELERIYMGGRKKKTGHPVHYLIRTDDRVVSERICETLLAALFANGRIKSKRYCVVEYGNGSGGPDEAYDALYQSSENGAVIVRYQGENLGEMRHSRGGEDNVSSLCETVLRYKNKVLTILCLPRECSKAKDSFFEMLGTTVFVELYEDVVFGEDAKKYLKLRAKECHISADKKLIAAIDDRERGFQVKELNRIFDEWYDHKLRFSIYPQYKEMASVKQQIVKENPRGSAYARLQELVGISGAKRVMIQAINYYKAQKLFADRGMKTEKPSMHMVFTGNPGTAKTTVARLFAQIMKENGLLSKGELYEVGRADIVGKYVGHTAPLVKQAFCRAKGGVLFIDEAYSLMDGKDGLYGDEAINTIVQEMENHREDTVVIFAGYPDKMEQFLKKNPGLRSRIAFHIPFDDYSEEELCQIAELIARDKGLELSEGAIAKLHENFAVAKESEDFGNGRYVRNLIEKAKMALANRLIEQDIDAVTERDIVTICEEDVETYVENKRETGRRIGFMC